MEDDLIFNKIKNEKYSIKNEKSDYLNLFIGIYADRGTKILSFIILFINRTYKNLKSSLRTESQEFEYFKSTTFAILKSLCASSTDKPI